jgi:hypothetical protein
MATTGATSRELDAPARIRTRTSATSWQALVNNRVRRLAPPGASHPPFSRKDTDGEHKPTERQRAGAR